jgi:streptomycin 6-kinase
VNTATVPARVAGTVTARWPGRGERWLRDVEVELASLAARYGARPVDVFRARYGFVVALDRSGAPPLVMRSTADPVGPLQAAAAEYLGEVGIGPVVHEVQVTDTGTWTVMDRVTPGVPVEIGVGLADLAALLRPLVAEQPLVSGFPRLASWLRARLADNNLSDLAPGTAPAPLDERAHARALLADLGDGHAESLCHGDCSRDNVVRSGVGLALIDPRGVAGDIAYDVAVLAAKTGNSPAGLAELVGVDSDRAQAWAVVAGAARV